MENSSLSAQITSKNRRNKGVSNVDPLFFSQITYNNVKQINYLIDLEQKKKNLDFPIFQFEEDLNDQVKINEFDLLADKLYKKIMQKGNINEKKITSVSKKKKKTKNPFQYDYQDEFINDEEVFAPKKNSQLKFQNFGLLKNSMQQFYSSELYKSSMEQIEQQSKKRPNDIDLGPQQLESIKKKIKQDIANKIIQNKNEAMIIDQKKDTTDQNVQKQKNSQFNSVCNNISDTQHEQNNENGLKKELVEGSQKVQNYQNDVQKSDKLQNSDKKSTNLADLQNGGTGVSKTMSNQ